LVDSARTSRSGFFFGRLDGRQTGTANGAAIVPSHRPGQRFDGIAQSRIQLKAFRDPSFVSAWAGTRVSPGRFRQAGASSRERLMKTFSAKPHEVERDWFVVDATDKVLGRLAAAIAHRLRGKHKPEFTPHVDTGDFIVVVNAAKLRVTGNKAEDKTYFRHSGYPGGITETTFGKMQSRFPGRALEKAVKGMLPKGPLGYAMIKKLKVYAEGTHPHSAQQPKVLEV
jgi:large subunit ribosomal protein L13